MGKIKSNLEYLTELKIKNIEVTPLEEYQGAKIKILHRYNTCGHEAKVQPSSILCGYGCLICAKKNYGKTLKKTNEQYIKELKEINPNIVSMENYINSYTKILHKCLIHNYKWMALPTNLLKGHGCPICSGNYSMTNDEFMTLLLPVKNPNVIIMSKFINKTTKIKCKCSICGNKWETIPDGLLKGWGCRKCGRVEFGLRERLSDEEFKENIKEILPTIKIVGKYNVAINPIDCECMVCGHQWSPLAKGLMKGRGCPICNMSLGERVIYKYLKNNSIEFKIQKEFDNLVGVGDGLLSYDFYLTKLNKLIEYQGEQHAFPKEYFGGEEQFKIQQEHDRRKREYAKEHNMDLIEIWYYDYDNIEKILDTYLNSESVETTGDIQ